MKPCWVTDVRFRKGRRNAFLVRGATAFKLNDTGLAIWRACDGTRTLDEIASLVATSFGQEQAVVRADCEEFVNDLLGLRLLRVG